MLARVKFSICFLILSMFSVAQDADNGLVKWLTIKEAQEKNKLVQRPFLIDFYTDWCGWCRHMMKTTYSNPTLAEYINQNFYPVKFNAEGKDTIEYNGKTYKPISKEPKTPHEFAIKMIGQQLSYPSTIFVTNNFEYSLLSQGFMEEKKIEPILVFMVENVWRNVVFDDFNKNFTRTFYDTNFNKKPVKIYSVTEMQKLQKKKPKKVLVSVSTGFCNSCKVMSKTTFMDSAVAKIVNERYYLVEFNAESTDTVLFKNEKFMRGMVPNFPLHPFALKVSNNRFTLPMVCVLDEKLDPIDALNFYYTPELIRPALYYFADDHYKTKKWQDFITDYNSKKDKPAKK